MFRMPGGTVTEPAKTMSWKVVEERIKLKQSNARVALALRNAKIHRPTLYLSSKSSFNSALERKTRKTAPAPCRNSRVKTFPPKKVRVNKVQIKKERQEKSEATGENSTSKSQTSFHGDHIADKSGSTLDLKNLRCSCQIAANTTVWNKCEPDPARAESDDKGDKLVTLSTVNVQPWENDTIKTAAEMSEPAGQRSMNDGDKRTVRADFSRFVSLLKDSNTHRREDIKRCSPDDDGKVQHASPKLHRPGRIPCAHTPRQSQLDVSRLSGILLVSQSPKHLPPIQKTNNIIRTERDFSVFERGPILSLIKADCHLCAECRQTFQKVPKLYGSDKESENLIRLKYSLKLKERQFLEMERKFDKAVNFDNSKTSFVELAKDSRIKRLDEEFALPKLYLSHHSTGTVCKQKTKSPRTLSKITDATMTLEECSNQLCYKLARIEKKSAQEKSLKNSAKKGVSSAKLCEISGSLQPQANHVRVVTRPLRGFTPYFSDLTESPMLWREDSEIKGTEKEEATERGNIGVQVEENEYSVIM